MALIEGGELIRHGSNNFSMSLIRQPHTHGKQPSVG